MRSPSRFGDQRPHKTHVRRLKFVTGTSPRRARARLAQVRFDLTGGQGVSAGSLGPICGA